MIQVKWEHIHDLNFDDSGNISRQNASIYISGVGWAILSFLIEPIKVSEVIEVKVKFRVETAATGQLLNIGKLTYDAEWDCWVHGWNTSHFVVDEEPFGLYVEDSDALQSAGDKEIDLGHVADSDITSLLACEEPKFFGMFLKGETSDVATVASIAHANNDARPSLEIKTI